MIKVTINRTKTVMIVATLAVTYLLPGCGSEEDFYIDSQAATSTHSAFQQNAGLATEDSVTDQSNAKYQFDQDPSIDLFHQYTLDKAFGAERFIVDMDEISPQSFEPLEELPAPNFWHPEDDQDESPSETPVMAEDFTPVATPFNTTRPFDQLSNFEFGLVCKAIDHLYDAQDLEALSVGGCTYDIARHSLDFTQLDDNVCGRYMDNCLAQHQPFELPIGLCEARSQPPETCQVNYAQLQSCLQAVNATQAVLAEETICDTAIEDVTRTRVLLNQHYQARQCLTKLASHCPAIAPYGGE